MSHVTGRDPSGAVPQPSHHELQALRKAAPGLVTGGAGRLRAGRTPTCIPMTERSQQAEMFLNRVAKNYRHLRKWARREGIESFRVYDRDIPELPFALDVYGQHAQLQEYSAPVTEVRAQREWRSAMHAATAQALDIPLRQVVLKQRHGQRPDVQYPKVGPRGEDFHRGEGGH